jgi:hypothetical protein
LLSYFCVMGFKLFDTSHTSVASRLHAAIVGAA